MGLCYHFNAEVGTVIRAEGVAEHLGEREEGGVNISETQQLQRFNVFVTYLKFLRIVHPRNGLHQVGRRVVTEVRADVADAQASTAGLQVLWMLIGRFVQSINLQNKQRSKS